MRPRPLLAAAIPALLAALLAIVPVGCGGSDKSKTTKVDKRPQEDAWLRARTALRQETDAESLRRVLNELNAGLASAPAESPRSLSDADAAFARSSFNLTEAEVKEIRAGGYTALDANHLAEALYLRDVARSLDVAKLPVAERAAVAFGWVCRQVILRPWLTPIGDGRGLLNPPLPPTYVLRHGFGSGLERLYVFVALCRQLEIDAYPIGPAAAAGQGALSGPPVRGSDVPRGPFWGVGVRDGTDILLFDPWKEQPLPGKAGRPATLADVRADPRAVAVWLDNTAFAWGVTADDLKAGEIYLIAPLSALAPRNKAFEEKIAAEFGAKLAVDPAPMRKTAESAAHGAPVRFYSPPDEAFAPTRALASFLPIAEGGSAVETREMGASLAQNFIRDQIPAGLRYAVPAELASPDAKRRLTGMAASFFAGSFVMAPTPREKLQRGQFVEVTQHLVRLRDQFLAAETHARAEDREATRVWIEQVDALSIEINIAKPDEQQVLRTRLEALWSMKNPAVGSLLAGAIAPPGIAEATFLLALAKHEQAERVAAKAERLAAAPDTDPAKKELAQVRLAAADAWTDARDWWGRYEPFAAGQIPNHPGRAELAKRLSDRAGLRTAAK